MTLSGDEFLRLESLIYRPVSFRPDWLKAWRNEANYLLFLARRAEDADDIEMLQGTGGAGPGDGGHGRGAVAGGGAVT